MPHDVITFHELFLPGSETRLTHQTKARLLAADAIVAIDTRDRDRQCTLFGSDNLLLTPEELSNGPDAADAAADRRKVCLIDLNIEGDELPFAAALVYELRGDDDLREFLRQFVNCLRFPPFGRVYRPNNPT